MLENLARLKEGVSPMIHDFPSTPQRATGLHISLWQIDRPATAPPLVAPCFTGMGRALRLASQQGAPDGSTTAGEPPSPVRRALLGTGYKKYWCLE
jgi:hypothetical protein